MKSVERLLESRLGSRLSTKGEAGSGAGQTVGRQRALSSCWLELIHWNRLPSAGRTAIVSCHRSFVCRWPLIDWRAFGIVSAPQNVRPLPSVSFFRRIHSWKEKKRAIESRPFRSNWTQSTSVFSLNKRKFKVNEHKTLFRCFIKKMATKIRVTFGISNLSEPKTNIKLGKKTGKQICSEFGKRGSSSRPVSGEIQQNWK